VSWRGNKFPQAEAVLVYARGLGAARIGDAVAARADVAPARAEGRHDGGKIGYWPGQADFQIKGGHAWIALAEKRNDEALQLMRASADAEEGTTAPGNTGQRRAIATAAGRNVIGRGPATTGAGLEFSAR